MHASGARMRGSCELTLLQQSCASARNTPSLTAAVCAVHLKLCSAVVKRDSRCEAACAVVQQQSTRCRSGSVFLVELRPLPLDNHMQEHPDSFTVRSEE